MKSNKPMNHSATRYGLLALALLAVAPFARAQNFTIGNLMKNKSAGPG